MHASKITIVQIGWMPLKKKTKMQYIWTATVQIWATTMWSRVPLGNSDLKSPFLSLYISKLHARFKNLFLQFHVASEQKLCRHILRVSGATPFAIDQISKYVYIFQHFSMRIKVKLHNGGRNKMFLQRK
jgi:hypothetical protein